MTDRIGTSGLRGVLEFTEVLRSCADLAAFSTALVSGIANVVKSDHASLNEIDVVSKDAVVDAMHPVPVTTREEEAVRVLIAAHPIVRHYMAAVGRDARTLSDFWTQRELRRSRLYAQYYRARHIRYQLAVTLPGRPGTLRGLVVSRSGPDYTQRERELLEVVASQAADLEELIITRSLIREVLADVDSHDEQGHVLPGRAGPTEFMTGTARSAFARYLPIRNGRQLPSAVPAENQQQAMMVRIQAFIEHHLGDPGLSPAMIAAAHHVSVRTLHNLYEPGEHTVSGWIRHRRLERCRQDLLNPDLRDRPVGSIGTRWGFQDAAVFSRLFRRAYGLPPGEYRTIYGR